MLDLFLTWARVGATTFGGGPSMVPMIQAECVRKGYVDEAAFVDGLALANTLPGPIATKLAIWVGWTYAGAPGLVVALVGLLLPSGVAMLALIGIFGRYRDTPAATGALAWARPAVIGLLVWTVIDLAPAGVGSSGAGVVAAVAVVALLAGAHPAAVMGVAMGLGALLGRGP